MTVYELRLLPLNFLFFAFINAVLAAPPSYIQTKRRFFHHSHIYNEATKKVTVGHRKGGFKGMLQKRTFHINLITPGKTKRLDMHLRQELLYDGKHIEVKL